MVDPVGFRFCPTDEEIVGHYVRPKNLGSNTSHVDEVMNTVDIYSFDPWDLPCKSRIKSSDEVVWYFFGCKKNQQQMHNNKQSRRTASGFWSKTGVTTAINRKRGGRGDHEKIGEKRVFVFKYSKIPGGSKSRSKSDWVMHEYVATFSSPDSQTMMMTYTVCKVMFKGDPTDLPTSSSASQIQHLIPHVNSNNSGGLSTETEVQNPNQITTVSLIPQVNNNSGGLVTETENTHRITSTISLIPHVNNSSGGLGTETEVDPRLFSSFLYLEEDAHLEDATLRALNILPNNDDVEEEKLVNLLITQEDRNDYRPKKSLTGVFISDDDSDSDSITTTCFTKSSSTCVSFGSSNPLIDLPESPRSTIESGSVTQEVSKSLGTNTVTSKKKMSPCDDEAQGSEIRGDQMGQEMVIKSKRAGFIYRMIQKFAKKIKLCSCVSRT